MAKNGQKGSYNSRLSVSFISDQSIILSFNLFKVDGENLFLCHTGCIDFEEEYANNEPMKGPLKIQISVWAIKLFNNFEKNILRCPRCKKNI